MQIGDIAPDFELADQTGTPRKLSAVLADGPVKDQIRLMSQNRSGGLWL